MTALRALSFALFPALLVLFAAVYAVDPHAYRRLLQEDGPAENATVVLMLLASALWLIRLARLTGTAQRFRRFCAAVAVFCGLVAIDEVSWGQRIIGYGSPQFFREHAQQRETNIHNVVEKLAQLPTRAYLALACLAYGVYLPIASARRPRVAALTARVGLRVPPRFLAPGFALAALTQIDLPTGYEEEIGELFVSLLAVLFGVAELAHPARDESG